MLSRLPSVPGPVVGLAVLAPIAAARDAPPPMHAVPDWGGAWGDFELPGFWPGLKVAVDCRRDPPITAACGVARCSNSTGSARSRSMWLKDRR